MKNTFTFWPTRHLNTETLNVPETPAVLDDLAVAAAPVGVADGAAPLGRGHAHSAPAADPVAAASAHGAAVPHLAQRLLAAGAGALAVLPGGALGSFPPQLLELQLHPPEEEEKEEGKRKHQCRRVRSSTTEYRIQRNTHRIYTSTNTLDMQTFYVLKSPE